MKSISILFCSSLAYVLAEQCSDTLTCLGELNKTSSYLELKANLKNVTSYPETEERAQPLLNLVIESYQEKDKFFLTLNAIQQYHRSNQKYNLTLTNFFSAAEVIDSAAFRILEKEFSAGVKVEDADGRYRSAKKNLDVIIESNRKKVEDYYRYEHGLAITTWEKEATLYINLHPPSTEMKISEKEELTNERMINHQTNCKLVCYPV